MSYTDTYHTTKAYLDDRDLLYCRADGRSSWDYGRVCAWKTCWSRRFYGMANRRRDGTQNDLRIGLGPTPTTVPLTPQLHRLHRPSILASFPISGSRHKQMYIHLLKHDNTTRIGRLIRAVRCKYDFTEFFLLCYTFKPPALLGTSPKSQGINLSLSRENARYFDIAIWTMTKNFRTTSISVQFLTDSRPHVLNDRNHVLRCI